MKENDLDEINNKENENSELSSKNKKIRKKMNDLMQRHGLNVDLRKESWNSFYKKTGKILPDLLDNENDKKILLDYASYIDDNFEDFLINPIDFDIDFYRELKEKIELAFNKNSNTTNKILIDIHWKLEEKYNYNKIIGSILLYRDLAEEIGILVKNLPLRGDSEDYEKIFKKIQIFFFFFFFVAKFRVLCEFRLSIFIDPLIDYEELEYFDEAIPVLDLKNNLEYTEYTDYKFDLIISILYEIIQDSNNDLINKEILNELLEFKKDMHKINEQNSFLIQSEEFLLLRILYTRLYNGELTENYKLRFKRK